MQCSWSSSSSIAISSPQLSNLPPQSLDPMASTAKITLMFMLLAAMAMAAQAGSHPVSCTNQYCKPITVNNVLIGVNVTLNVLVDDVLNELKCEVPNLLGGVTVDVFKCPSEVTAVVILDVNLSLVLKVVGSTLASLLNTILGILGILNLNLALCL
jgi:hypothetical protein